MSRKNMFTVVKIIDGDTFKIKPLWRWGLRFGNIVRPTGYDTPERFEEGHREATLKLKKLILGKKVILGKYITLTYGRLLCPVYFQGKDLAEYFPEYKV